VIDVLKEVRASFPHANIVSPFVETKSAVRIEKSKSLSLDVNVQNVQNRLLLIRNQNELYPALMLSGLH
jgi:hypothetical protein